MSRYTVEPPPVVERPPPPRDFGEADVALWQKVAPCDEGWPAGGEFDGTADGIPAHQMWEDALARGETPETLFAQFARVREVMRSTGYPADKIHLVKGKVQDTIPGEAPERHEGATCPFLS